MGEQIDDEGETSEEVYKRDIDGERYSGRERKEWVPDPKKGTCVIWCRKIKLWHLVIGALGLRVTGI